MEHSPAPLAGWLLAVWARLNPRPAISCRKLHDVVGVSIPAAWFLLHRIRLAMNTETFSLRKGERELTRLPKAAAGEATQTRHPGDVAEPVRKICKSRFEQSLEFAQFKRVMERLLAIPKCELDQAVRRARIESPRRDNPFAPGRRKAQLMTRKT